MWLYKIRTVISFDCAFSWNNITAVWLTLGNRLPRLFGWTVKSAECGTKINTICVFTLQNIMAYYFFFNASERRRDFCFQEHLPGVNCQLRWNSQEVWSNVTCLELNPTPQWKTFPQQNHCKVLPAFTRNRTTISIHERPTSITNACGFHWNVCTLCRTEFNETYRLKYSVISFSVVDSGKFPTRRYLVSRTISLLYYIPSNMNLKHADIFVWNSTLHYTLRLRCSPDKKFMQTAWRHYHVTCI